MASKPLSALSTRTPTLSDFVYGIDNGGTADGKILISALLSLVSSPSIERTNVVQVLEAGKSYIVSGVAAKTLPAITADGVSITIVRNDPANDFLVNPVGGDTVGGDSSLNVDVDLATFRLVANSSTNDWEVYT